MLVHMSVTYVDNISHFEFICQKQTTDKKVSRVVGVLVDFLHTIGHYNPSVRITAYLLTLLILWALILYVSGGTYSLKSAPNDRFLRNL